MVDLVNALHRCGYTRAIKHIATQERHRRVGLEAGSSEGVTGESVKDAHVAVRCQPECERAADEACATCDQDNWPARCEATHHSASSMVGMARSEAEKRSLGSG